MVRALEAAADEDVVGAIIRVDGPDGTWTATAGSAEAGRERPVDPEGRFRIGSITKTFVATVVLQLVDEGEIELDEPIQSHLPHALPPDYPSVTVRQLLQHTSGIHNYRPYVMHDPEQIMRGRHRDWIPAELVAIATAHPRDFEPGAEQFYVNTNYVLLGMLIQEVTGNWWGKEVDRRIAGPLGLTSTVAPGDDPELPGPFARGYLTVHGHAQPADITEVKASVTDAAGAMISSARDLNVFFAALLDGEVVPAPLLDQMLAPFTGKSNFDGIGGYGLGVQTLHLPAECGEQPAYGHGGGTIGYAGLTFSTRHGERRVTASFSTTSPDEESSPLGKLLAITRLALCG